jgi:hypothetical protein
MAQRRDQLAEEIDREAPPPARGQMFDRDMRQIQLGDLAGSASTVRAASSSRRICARWAASPMRSTSRARGFLHPVVARGARAQEGPQWASAKALPAPAEGGRARK